MQQNAGVADVARNKIGCMRVAEAARRLEVHRATLGRYLRNYPELLDPQGRVDFEELVQHRKDNPQIADAAERPKRQIQVPSEKPEGGRVGNKHRLEEIKTWEAERDYAKSLGQLVDPAAIVDALSEMAVALRDKFMSPDPVLCERIAGESDPRQVMQLLREANRAALVDFVEAMKRIAGTAPALDDAAA